MSTLTAESVAAPDTQGTSVNQTKPPAPSDRRGRSHLWILLGITVLGVVLRFSFLDRPPLWGDDAYTVYRTHADYQSMLDILQNDGFTPLHYELYWLIGRLKTEMHPGVAHGAEVSFSTALTTKVVRLLPAFWGALMPPAIYFLAVQLVRRRTALVAALIAACSAYLLGYSKDGKMYMMLWSLTALSTACLLWWLNTRTRVAWLAWVASTLGMCSAHMTGPAMLPFQAVFFITRSKVEWKNAILFVLGVLIVVSGPIAYDRQFNRWSQENNQDYGFDVEGLGWVISYNEGRTGTDLIRYAAPAYLFSWEWPKPISEAKIAPWLLASLKIATVVLVLLAAVGAMPWTRRWRGVGARGAGQGAGQLETPCGAKDESPQPWWRVYMWLGLWLVVPVYFVYCRSTIDFASPRTWWDAAGSILGGSGWLGSATTSPWLWLWLGLAAAAIAVPVFLFAQFRRVVFWLIPGLAGLGLLTCLLRVGSPTATDAAGWVLYFARPLNAWWEWITQPVVATVLVVVLPGLLLYYSGQTWTERARHVLQFAAVSAVLLGACVLVYYLALGEFNERLEKTLKAMGGSTIANATSTQLEKAKDALHKRDWHTIFMPRYFGFAFVAFCIALAALYMRLPGRGFRIAAVVVLIGINLAQFGGRLFAGTEPPLPMAARDIWRYDTIHNPKGDPTGRVYINDSGISDPVLGGAGHPACGTLDGQQGRYCLGEARGYFIHPAEWKTGGSAYRNFDIHTAGGRGRGGSDMQQERERLILSELKSSPDLKRVVLWEKFNDKIQYVVDPATKKETCEPTSSGAAGLVQKLEAAGWKKVSVQAFPVRFHWEWKELYTYWRLEFSRGE